MNCTKVTQEKYKRVPMRYSNNPTIRAKLTEE